MKHRIPTYTRVACSAVLLMAGSLVARSALSAEYLSISSDSVRLIAFAINEQVDVEIQDEFFDDLHRFDNLAVIDGRVIVSGTRKLPEFRYRRFFGEYRDGRIIEFGEGGMAQGLPGDDRVFFFRAIQDSDQPFFLHVATLGKDGISNSKKLLNAFPDYRSKNILIVDGKLVFFDTYSEQTLLYDIAESRLVDSSLASCLPRVVLPGKKILCKHSAAPGHFIFTLAGDRSEPVDIKRGRAAFSDGKRIFLSSLRWSWRHLGQTQHWYVQHLPGTRQRNLVGMPFIIPNSVIELPPPGQ